MNSSHYPSLELCKKLTEIGFQRTQFGWTTGFLNLPQGEYAIDNVCRDEDYVCPSVMEILDVMPKDYSDTFVSSFKRSIDIRNEEQGMTVNVTKNGATIYKEFTGNFPNALAEMILWLHENNYISFSK